MPDVGAEVDPTSRVLDTLKDLPLWLFAGIAIGVDALLFIPLLANQLLGQYRAWLIIIVVFANILALTRGIDLLVGSIKKYRASRQARRTFHMSPNDSQSFWSVARLLRATIIVNGNNQ
jgi:hypothetical protein